MQMLASLDMATETAEHLIDFIITTTEAHNNLDDGGIPDDTVNVSDPDSSAVTSSNCSPLMFELTSLPADQTLNVKDPPIDDTPLVQLAPSTDTLPVQPMPPMLPVPPKSAPQAPLINPKALSIQAALAPSIATMRAATQVINSTLTIVAQAPAPPPPIPTLAHNPVGHFELVGGAPPNDHLAVHQGFVYDLTPAHAPGPFYVVTRGLHVGLFSGWYIPILSCHQNINI